MKPQRSWVMWAIFYKGKPIRAFHLRGLADSWNFSNSPVYKIIKVRVTEIKRRGK